MRTFLVTAKTSNVLISLFELIERIDVNGVANWRFKEVSLFGAGRPFGMTFQDFEAATRAPHGFAVPDSDFRNFLIADFQIVDGIIEAWSDQVPSACILCFDCEDASRWEISTGQMRLAEKIELLGFKEA